MSNKCDKRDSKIALINRTQSELNSKIEFIERCVENIKSPRENALSSIKGELKVSGADAGWLPWLPGQPPFCFEIKNSV